MEESLLSVGQEHVEAKEAIKTLRAEKTSLQERVDALELQVTSHNAQNTANAEAEAEASKLSDEYDELKSKTMVLQTDLAAAQHLASARYRDLTDLKELLAKAQPELKALRSENAALKNTKDELTAKTAELRRLEAREKDLRSDIASFKKQAADSEREIRSLNEKVVQESGARAKAEDLTRYAQRDMRKAEAQKVIISASSEKTSAELAKVVEEATKLRQRVRDLEVEVEQVTAERNAFKEEVGLRNQQVSTSEALMTSMRAQTAEMAQQMREAKEASESMEEELVEVQRLLSERSREAETMRRLLSDVDGRAETKIADMKERMEKAEAEKERLEDDSRRDARRRAREGEDMKARVRDLEKDIARVEQEREGLRGSEAEWKRRRDEHDADTKQKEREIEELRAAVRGLRDALEDSEKSVREAEPARAELRKTLDEANARYDKLQHEFKQVQQHLKRPSIDVSRGSNGSAGRTTSLNAQTPGAVPSMDYVYLKTILLQFLEQKDKRIQTSLVKTVLGQLLMFDQ